MKEITGDTLIRFNGGVLTATEFANKYADGVLEDGIGGIEILIKKGRISIVENNSKDKKIIEKVTKEENIRSAADEYDREDEEVLDKRAENKRDGRLTYPEIELDYPTLSKAREHEYIFRNQLRIKDIHIEIRDTAYVMVLRNITDAELNSIQRTYKSDRAIQAAVGMINSGFDKATGAVHYTANQVINPMVKVGAKAGASLLKTLVTVTAKTAGALLTATTQGVKQAATEVKHDPDVLRAGRELIETKDAVMRKVTGFKSAGGGSGIRIKN